MSPKGNAGQNLGAGTWFRLSQDSREALREIADYLGLSDFSNVLRVLIAEKARKIRNEKRKAANT